MYGVVEYCGLNSAEVFDGYLRETSYVRRRDGITDPVARWLRIRGLTAADLEYGDRGLGGYRNWCRTEGLELGTAFPRFPRSKPGRRGALKRQASRLPVLPDDGILRHRFTADVRDQAAHA